MSDDAYEQVRTAGRRAAREAVEHRPSTDPLAAVAWTAGFDAESPELAALIVEAKDAGHTWEAIATAAGLPLRTIISRGYRARKRAESGE